MGRIRSLSRTAALGLVLVLALPASGAAPIVSTRTPVSARAKLNRVRVALGKAALAFAVVNTAAIPLVALSNRALEDKPSTIVYSAGRIASLRGPVPTALVDYFMYTPVVLRQTLRGHRVEWHSNATTKEIRRTFPQPSFQNIVFVGHGSQGRFETPDGYVNGFDLYDANWDRVADRPGPVKRGEIIQLTCGALDKGEAGYMAQGNLAPTGLSIRFTRVIDPVTNYLGAWKLVFSDTLSPNAPRDL